MSRSPIPVMSGFLFSLLTAALILAAPEALAATPPETTAGKMILRRPRAPGRAPRLGAPKLKLTIREAIGLALARNFDITIESFNPRIRESELAREKAPFDPVATASLNSTKSKLDTSSTLRVGGQSIRTETKVEGGIEHKIITGTQYSLLFQGLRERSNSRFAGVNPSFQSGFVFTITQPLLKNFGIDVNTADIRVASAARDQSLHTYRGKVIEVVDDVEQAYWDLVFARATLEFRKKSLDLSKDLLRRNRIQVEVGTLAPIEILEAEATVAAREDDVIRAERDVQDREDTLKKLLNIPTDTSSWNIQLTPSEKPVFRARKLNETQMILNALRKRTDFQNARIEIEKKEIALKKARSNLLPELNLSGSASNPAISNNITNSLNRMTTNKSYSFSAGINFRIPLGNRQAKADLEKARVETLQAITSFNQLEQSIIEEVRRNVRRVRTNRKRIEATRLARRLAEERLSAQEKKFSVGLSTSRDVLEDQEKLTNALTNETQALIDYNKSLASLFRATHSTLERFRIRLDDPRKETIQSKP